MQHVEPNPYSPPKQHPAPERVSADRWRLVPATISFFLGIASFMFGILAVSIMAYVLLTQNANETVGRMFAGCTLYLGFGSSWMVAGWWYWRRQYRIAALANAVGLMVPVVLIAILGV